MRTWMKELRISKGLTQEKVAESAGIKRPYYAMIESGDRNPSVNVAKLIADKLDFNWTIFFDKECNEKTHSEEVI
ncbi:helix-turn-helix transcriptional regulator [Paenalkalicoccus suaedae]|uniref:Helix-turn-helix transcriptional regulator n=1 Tax=Paenalkalicoccus suaedae TaxID=2592382 RepID=A0A859FG03_9BACI|nr:helix-turn-helix transcriptional regulator [Paenalkalicoccus suaedae]QKS71941.1 helix-turn-helix transcriptional regulator [Paenalkalicoccus suaedae]